MHRKNMYRKLYLIYMRENRWTKLHSLCGTSIIHSLEFTVLIRQNIYINDLFM